MRTWTPRGVPPGTRHAGWTGRLALAAAGSLVFASGCSGDLPLDDRPCPCADGYRCCELTRLCVENGAACSFEVEPSDAKLRLGATLRFRSSVPVTWTLDSPQAGSIDADGRYHASKFPGKYRVRARTAGGASLTANVRVGPTELVAFIGVPGGSGNTDGVGANARFDDPTSITGDDEYLYVSDGSAVGWSLADGACDTCLHEPDAAACLAQYLVPHPEQLRGVRRVSRSNGEVTWLVKDRILEPLARADSGLIAGASLPAMWDETHPPEGSSGPWQIYCGVARPIGARAVVRVDPDSGEVTPIAGVTSPDGSPRDGVGADARFQAIHGMAAYGGSVYVTDGAAVRQVELATGRVTTLAAGPSWTGEKAGTAPFGTLGAAALAGDTLYAVDNEQVTEIPMDDGNDFFQTVWTINVANGLVHETAVKLCSRADGLDMPYRISGSCYDSELRWTVGNCIGSEGMYGPGCWLGDIDTAGASDGYPVRFDEPTGIWCAGDGTYYVSDSINSTIRELTATGGSVTLAGSAAGDGTSQPGPTMKLTPLLGMTANAAGHVVAASSHELVWIDPSSKIETHPSPPFYGPIALGPDLTVYTRYWNLSLNTDALFTTQLTGDPLYGTSTFVDFAHDGNAWLYVSDTTAGCRVVHFDSHAALKTQVYDGLCGPLTMNGDNEIFIADHGLEKTTSNHLFGLDLVARKATALPDALDGWAATALAYDPAGVLYVAEAGRQRVRGLIVDSGEVFDLVGSAGEIGVRPGVLPAALSQPSDIALLPDGRLVIADSGENVLLLAQ